MTLSVSKADILKFITKVTAPWLKDAGNDGLFEVRCLGENRTPNYQFFSISQIPAASDYARKFNELGLNVYLTINPVGANLKASGKGSKDEDILRAHFNFADADDVAGLTGLKQLCSKVQPDIVVVTGQTPYERRHAYWQLQEPCEDLSAWTTIQKTIASQFKTDKTVSNPSRIMRVPGTISFPPKRKQERGYVTELVTLKEA
jgi:hypothetical protein